MKTFITTKPYKYYLFIGALWLLIWIVIRLINNPETFVLHAMNEVWRTLYVLILNFIFFEYILPLIRKKRSTILLNVLAGMLLVSLLLLFLSLGLYGWTSLGIQLQVYTSVIQVSLVGGAYDELLYKIFHQAEYGLTSAFFFFDRQTFLLQFQIKTGSATTSPRKEGGRIKLSQITNKPPFFVQHVE